MPDARKGHVKIVNDSGLGRTTRIEIDGVEVPRVRHVSFAAGVHGSVSLTLEVLPASIEIVTHADVKIVDLGLQPLPPCAWCGKARSEHREGGRYHKYVKPIAPPADASLEAEGYGLV